MFRAAEERELFQGRVPQELRTMEIFPTKFVGIAAQDDTADLSRTAGVLQRAFGMDPDSISPQDRKEVGCQTLNQVSDKMAPKTGFKDSSYHL